MKYIYKNALLPKNNNSSLLVELNRAAERLQAKLQAVKNDDLKNLSPPGKKYYLEYNRNLLKVLQRFAYALLWLLDGIGDYKNCTVLDHGGGLGLMSLLCKEIGIKKVIYNDIDGSMLSDAREISKLSKINIDYYIKGEINDVIIFAQKNGLDINGIISNDVIEHIYDLGDFVESLRNVSDSYCFVIISGANQFNPIIKNDIIRGQNSCEFGRIKSGKHQSGFLETRRQIIESEFPSLSEKEIKILSRLTRGKKKNIISSEVAEYVKTKSLPAEIKHPTNTCDPWTGNWKERLINPFYFKRKIEPLGFKVKIIAGYWNHLAKGLSKKPLSNLINYFIRISGKEGLRVAPYYMIVGRYNHEKLS